MIKQGIKNYFKNLKYIFTPLGAMMLGAVIGLSILLPGIVSSIEKLAKSVQDILSESNIDFVQLKDHFATAIKELDWANPVSAASTMLSNEWINQTLTSCIGVLVEGSEVYVLALSGAVDAFSLELVGYLVGFFIFIGLGIIVGFIITKWIIRQDIAKRSLVKFILVTVFDGVLTVAFLASIGWLTSKWKPSIYISFVVFMLLYRLVSLLEAYLVQGKGKVEPKKVINLKNIISLIAVDLVIIIFSVALVSFANFVINQVVAVFLGVAIFEIAIIIMNLNAESYVKTLASETGENNQTETTEKKVARKSKKTAEAE